MLNSYGLAESINSDVNTSVTWMSDSEQFGVPEFWCEARSGFDDCDGYALLKRALLIVIRYIRATGLIRCIQTRQGIYC